MGCPNCKYCRIPEPEEIPPELWYEDEVIYCTFLDEFVVVCERCPYFKEV